MVRDSGLNLADLDKSLDELIKEDRKRKQNFRKRGGRAGGGPKSGGRGGKNNSSGGGSGSSSTSKKTSRRSGGGDAKSQRGRGRTRGRGRASGAQRARNSSRNGPRKNNNNGSGGGGRGSVAMKKRRGRGSGVSGYSYTEARGGGRSAAAKRAQSRANGASAQRRPLEVSTTGVLLINGLQLHVTSDDVKEIFDRKGIVTSAFVKFDKSGKPTGQAEVTFARKQDARDAQRAFDGAKVDGVPISVRLAAFSPAKTTVVSGRRNAKKPHPLKR